MDELVFLDTETTGNDLLTDYLFEVCYAHNGTLSSDYFKPQAPISIKSQSITHVTNTMVAEKQPFMVSPMRTRLMQLLQSNILVAHNAVFDIEMLFKEGVTVPRFICTLKVARFLDTEGIIPEYNLQYLRYYLELNVDATAHNAQDDVKVLESLFKWQYAQMLQIYGDHKNVIAKMEEVTKLPSLFKTFMFGKYRGKKIEEVVYLDRPYLEWMLEKKLEHDLPDEDWIFTLKFHLHQK